MTQRLRSRGQPGIVNSHPRREFVRSRMETCSIARSRCNAEELGAPLSSHCPRHFEADDIGLPLKVATSSRRMAYASGIPTHWWKSWACGTRQTIRHRSKSDTSCLPAGYRLQLCQHLFKPHPQINKHMVRVIRPAVPDMHCGCRASDQNGIRQLPLEPGCSS